MLRRSRWLTCLLLVSLAVLCVGLGLTAASLPPFQERFGWRLSEARAQIWYAFFPPEQSVFTPDPTLAAMVRQTLTAAAPTAAPSATPQPEAPPSATPTATATRPPLPPSVELSGVRHEYQKWNNCGPATLAMGLSFWDWAGDQRPVAEFTKPNPRDKNVMPSELVDFVNSQTSLRALTRDGGDLDLLKALLAAGFPVILEKGFEGYGFEGWMGHYALVTGYDDARERVTTQDSYIGDDFPFGYADLVKYWRNFNYSYIVVYPPEREAELMALLGNQADVGLADAAAAERASSEIYQLDGRDRLFAWFNRGSSLVALQDYAGAAAAYDEAFRIDAELVASDPENRPYRIMWYRTGPYKAYFYSGRYYDVINLATQTLSNMSEPVLEESYYWRGLAREAIGDVDGAIEDLRAALNMHPGFQPAIDQLQRLGVDV